MRRVEVPHKVELLLDQLALLRRGVDIDDLNLKNKTVTSEWNVRHSIIG